MKKPQIDPNDLKDLREKASYWSRLAALQSSEYSKTIHILIDNMILEATEEEDRFSVYQDGFSIEKVAYNSCAARARRQTLRMIKTLLLYADSKAREILGNLREIEQSQSE